MSKRIFAPGSRDSELKIVTDEIALDGSNPTTVDFTGILREVVGFIATYKGSSTPGDANSILTYNISADKKKVDVYAWVHAAADPTLQASTATATFTYVAFGY